MEINKEKTERLRSLLLFIYGQEEGKKRYISLMKSSALKVLKFKYGKIDGELRYKELREKDKIKNTLIGFINRYGEEEGTIKYYEKNKRLSVSVNSLKLNGFSDEEIKKIRGKHSKGSKTDLNSMVEKYGKEEGEKKYQNKIENYFNPWNYIDVMKKDGVNEEEAKKIVSLRQIRDRNCFINKYGKEEGDIRYDNMNKKRSYYNTKIYYVDKYGEEEGLSKYKEACYKRGESSRLSYFIEKYGEEDGNKKYLDLVKKKINYFPDFSSVIEKEFNNSIYEILDSNLKTFFYGYPITKPYFLNVDFNIYKTHCVVPDIKIRNIVIEFDGDYWHSKPKIIERDLIKNRIYEDNNFYLIRVKEGDYLNNKIGVINEVINLINKNIKK